jgi:type IV pilus assembly protein PilN
LIRINLLTEARAAAAKKKGPALPTGAKLNNLLLIGGLLLGVIYMGTMYLVLSSKSRRLDEEIGKAREEVARLKSIIEEVKGYEDKKKSLEEKIALINSLKTNQKGPVRLMDEVSKALPDLVWLTDMQIAGDQLTLKGRTLSPNAVATYLENLKKSPYFAEPVFKNLGREAGPQGIYTWEMAVTFTHGKSSTPSAPGATAPGKPGPGQKPAGAAAASAAAAAGA